MKKLLALVLALVMVLSLCVTSNAAFAGEEYDYDEAVEVMAAVGVFQGDENGKFNGKQELTREQAAKLIAYLDLGEKVAEALPAVKVFNDVEATRWSAKYVAYCADAGYLAGVGDNNFDPAGKLTGYAFAKMLLCVLGYDQVADGLTGSSWQINVAKLLATDKKLAKGIAGSPSAALTREEAAQYCLNTLKQTTVTASTGVTTVVNGVTVTTSGSKATDDGAGHEFYKTIDNLTYDESSVVDDFERTAYTWKLKGDEIGTYASADADYTFVATKDYAVSDDSATVLKGIQDATGNKKLAWEKNDTHAITAKFYVNGVEKDVTGDSETAALEAGDTVEVYLNENTNDIDKVVVAQYALTKLNVSKAAVASKDSKGESYTYNISRADGAAFTSTPDTDFPGYDAATYVKDAFIAVAVNGSGKVIDSYVPTYVTGAISAIATKNVTVAGTKYTFVGEDISYNPNTLTYANIDWKTGEYGVWVDANGYAFGLKTVSGTKALTEVYYVNDVWMEKSTAFGTDSYKGFAQVVALDGTISTIELGYAEKTVTNASAKDLFDERTLEKVTSTSAVSGDYYQVGKNAMVKVGDLITYSYNSTDKVNDAAAFNNAANSSYYVASGAQTLASDAKRTSINVNGGVAAYITGDTKFVVCQKDGKDLKVTELVGGATLSGANTVVIASKDSNKNYVAEYIVVDLGADYAGTVKVDDYLYVDSASSTYVGSGKYAVDVYDMKGNKTTVTATGTGSDDTFYTASVDTDGVYTLSTSDVTDLSIASPYYWKDEAGVLTGKKFVSLYGTLMTLEGNFKEIETADAVVVDLRDTTEAGQYDGAITSVADIYAVSQTVAETVSSTDYNYAVTLSICVAKTGATVIFVTDATSSNPS